MSPRTGILQGHEMDDEEISAFLTEQGVGVLSMSNEGTPSGYRSRSDTTAATGSTSCSPGTPKPERR